MAPAPTVNFHPVEAFSGALPDRVKLMADPVLMAPVATNRHTETQTPSPAAPPTVLVYSPSFVRTPFVTLAD